MSLREFHGHEDGVRWRLVPAGVEVEGSGVERTRGVPSTVTRVWEAYSTEINRTARAYRVPCHLIVATICTESGGKADAVRLEPGYVSDEQTPRKVSAGLMQTLIATARETMQMSLGRDWLLVPGNSIEAGTAYVAKQAGKTRLDPPFVAAAYNAGGVYTQTGAQNRWRLRQYPIGTGAHVDRFVRFFNDAAFVLASHSVRPAVGLEALLGDAEAPEAATRAAGAARAAQDGEVAIEFAKSANPDAVTPYSRQVLEEILRAARLRRAVISSTSRDPENQARVMYDNCERYGVEAQKKLYARAGDQVIDVYARCKAAGKTGAETKREMAEKIRELGPTAVSRHAADPKVLNVFDVAPSSIRDRVGFEAAVKGDRRVATFLTPPVDPGYHLEIPQRSAPG